VFGHHLFSDAAGFSVSRGDHGLGNPESPVELWPILGDGPDQAAAFVSFSGT
jgi:hypothetical protein